MQDESQKAGKLATLALGWAGVLPFLACAGAVAMEWQVIRATAVFVAYGAVILSFLGGIRWGQAVLTPDNPSAWALKMSVLPALLGWLALLQPGVLAPILTLTIGFAVMLWLDVFSKLAVGPDHFKGLRLQLSVAVLIVHIVMLIMLIR